MANALASRLGYNEIRLCGEQATGCLQHFGSTPAALYRPTVGDNALRNVGMRRRKRRCGITKTGSGNNKTHIKPLL
jgi:hypothetical protein